VVEKLPCPIAIIKVITLIDDIGGDHFVRAVAVLTQIQKPLTANLKIALPVKKFPVLVFFLAGDKKRLPQGVLTSRPGWSARENDPINELGSRRARAGFFRIAVSTIRVTRSTPLFPGKARSNSLVVFKIRARIVFRARSSSDRVS
jgi:hypothetical protein